MRNKLTTLCFALAALVGGSLASSPAHAGRGATNSSIRAAVRTNNADVIISEIERAERLVCGDCIAVIRPLLDSEDARIREVAAWWFARRPAQKTEITAQSVARLQGSDAKLARNAADALGTFRHPDAISALTVATKRADLPSFARAAAVKALGTIAHPSAEDGIVAVLTDNAVEVRLAAVQAYYDLRGVRTGQPLVALVADTDTLVRRAASATLGSYALVTARTTFEKTLATDADPMVRRNAAWALGKIIAKTGESSTSRAVLEAAVANDASSLVRGVARAAIRGLR